MIERLRVRIPAGAAGEFSSLESTLCADSYSVSVPPLCYCSGTEKTPVILPKVQMAGTPKHAYTLTQRSRSGLTMPLSRHSVGTYQENELTHNSSGNTLPQSSQLAEPLWIDSGLKNGIGVRELISTTKTNQNKKTQACNHSSNLSLKPSPASKKSANSDFVGSRVYACLGVTCNLHFWQNDRGLLNATEVTWGWNGHQVRVSTQSRLWRRKFFCRSCRNSNSQPFDCESGIRTNKLSRLPRQKIASM